MKSMLAFEHKNYDDRGEYNTSSSDWTKGWYKNKVFVWFKTKKESVLDVGCGNGRLGKFLKQYFSRVIGIDLFDYSSNFCSDYTKVTKGNFETYRFKEKFDTICFFSSFYQMEDKLKAMRKVKSLLKENGEIVLVGSPARGREPYNYDLDKICEKLDLKIIKDKLDVYKDGAGKKVHSTRISIISNKK